MTYLQFLVNLVLALKNFDIYFYILKHDLLHFTLHNLVHLTFEEKYDAKSCELVLQF